LRVIEPQPQVHQCGGVDAKVCPPRHLLAPVADIRGLKTQRRQQPQRAKLHATLLERLLDGAIAHLPH